MGRKSRSSPEVRERAVRLVLDHESGYDSPWPAIKSLAEKVGCSAEALRKWVGQAEIDSGQRPGVSACRSPRSE